MIGVCRAASETMMVLELAALGSMLNFLHDNPGSCSTNWEFPIWVREEGGRKEGKGQARVRLPKNKNK